MIVMIITIMMIVMIITIMMIVMIIMKAFVPVQEITFSVAWVTKLLLKYTPILCLLRDSWARSTFYKIFMLFLSCYPI